MLVISNSSPIIALNRIGKLELLKRLYKEIFIPTAVAKELSSDTTKKMGLDKLSWLKIKPFKQLLSVDILSVNLGPGESETIALALELKADLVLLDELAARDIAESLNLKFTGTLGIILKAKKRNLIPSVKETIDNLIKHEFRLSAQLYRDVLELANER